jgi:hypothetical protein
MTQHEVMQMIEKWTTVVFEADYGIRFAAQDNFVWMQSGSQTKFSMHLTINLTGPQLVFKSNLSDGAKDFAVRLKKRLMLWAPEVAGLLDLDVYTRDREWRAPGSAKVEKPESILQFLDLAHTWKDALVTWLPPPEVSASSSMPLLTLGS